MVNSLSLATVTDKISIKSHLYTTKTTYFIIYYLIVYAVILRFLWKNYLFHNLDVSRVISQLLTN